MALMYTAARGYTEGAKVLLGSPLMDPNLPKNVQVGSTDALRDATESGLIDVMKVILDDV